MNSEEEKEISNYEDARHLANIGVWSVELQVERLKKEDQDDAEFVMRKAADFHFLVVALMRVRRAATLVSKSSNIKNAIGKFDKEVPSLRSMRNVLEHIDDYIDGKGRDTSVVIGELFIYAFGSDKVAWSKYEIDLEKALKASANLFKAIQENPPSSYAKFVAAQTF